MHFRTQLLLSASTSDIASMSLQRSASTIQFVSKHLFTSKQDGLGTVRGITVL